jgi:hypothetical protein
MELTLAGHKRHFLLLEAFRAEWGLPDEFRVAYFEPKTWAGLGTLGPNGEALLTTIKTRVLAALPPTLDPPALRAQIEVLSHTFRYELELVNEQIQLRPHDVGYAVAGFQDVLQAVVYRLLELHYTDPATVRRDFEFQPIYQAWLDAGARVDTKSHSYTHARHEFVVRVIYNPYGRIGLEVEVAGGQYYLADTSLACPAGEFMEDLLRVVSKALCEAFGAQ